MPTDYEWERVIKELFEESAKEQLGHGANLAWARRKDLMRIIREVAREEAEKVIREREARG